MLPNNSWKPPAPPVREPVPNTVVETSPEVEVIGLVNRLLNLEENRLEGDEAHGSTGSEMDHLETQIAALKTKTNFQANIIAEVLVKSNNFSPERQKAIMEKIFPLLNQPGQIEAILKEAVTP